MGTKELCAVHNKLKLSQACPYCKIDLCNDCLINHKCSSNKMIEVINAELKQMSTTTIDLLEEIDSLINSVGKTDSIEKLMEIQARIDELNNYGIYNIKDMINSQKSEIETIKRENEQSLNNTKEIIKLDIKEGNKYICEYCSISLKHTQGYLCEKCPKLFICKQCQSSHAHDHKLFSVGNFS